MVRTAIASAVAGVFLFGLATAAFAVTGEFNNMGAEGLPCTNRSRPTAP
jgi:hypothetical protein